MALPFKPWQNVDLTLIRPLVRLRDQPRAHGVASDVFPLCGVAGALTELRVPVVLLPQRFLVRTGPPAGHDPLPVLDPRPESRLRIGRRAEQVNVIRHDDISANHPPIRRHPGIPEPKVYVRMSKQWPPVAHADGKKDNRGPILVDDRRRMRRVFSPRHGHAPDRRFRQCDDQVPRPDIPRHMEGRATRGRATRSRLSRTADRLA